MPSFDIIKSSSPSHTFRTDKIRGMFDYDGGDIVERFTGEIKDFDDWNIGLICGNSGTGKSTIAKNLFGDIIFENGQYKEKSVIDDMPEAASCDDIVKAFNSVGFSSVPSWFKPYNVLSNGEKMRVDLAYAILSDSDIFAFDEFTSVVDRTVAKVGSYAIQKAIRGTGKRFIAISCHEDIKDWLMPDWVFDTNSMKFSDLRGQKKNRPESTLQFRKIKPEERDEVWGIFRKYHYLNHDLNKGSQNYVVYYEDKLCAFISIIHFPHPRADNIKKVHRLVVLPDYQGMGIGGGVLDKVSEYYKMYRFIITTSNPALVACLKNRGWVCINYGINTPHTGTLKSGKFGVKRRITTSWEKKRSK